MITPSALITATGLRLRQRIYCGEDGRVSILRDAGHAVFVTPSQKRDILIEYDAAVEPINRQLRWTFTLSIPASLITFIVTANLDPDGVIDRLPEPIPSLVLVMTFIWLPLLGLYLHHRSMRAVGTALDRLLATLPPAPTPPQRPVAFQKIQIIALFFVGPALLFDVFGKMNSDAFANTPLSGRSVTVGTIIGLLLFVMLALPRVLHKWRARYARPSEPVCDVAIDANRTSRLLNRARAHSAAHIDVP